MGITFAPLGAMLPELFPTRLRYTGASVAYNLGGILGASLAPYIAQRLAIEGGLAWVGYYLSTAAAISFLSVLTIRETKGKDPTWRSATTSMASSSVVGLNPMATESR